LISGLASIAILAAAVGLSEDHLSEIIKKEYKRNLKENTAFGTTIFFLAEKTVGHRFSLKRLCL
jgi:hypothetical protein